MGAPRNTHPGWMRELHSIRQAKGGAGEVAGLQQGELATATLTQDARLALGKGLSARAAEARYARLFTSLRAPAIGMVRKAFGSAFSEDELDDLYSSAWVSTLGALKRKPRKLADGELRRYIMTAVANQAGREMRRRSRKPTVSLDAVAERSSGSESPEEAAAQTEQAEIVREVLASLSPRRRAVLVYRYGWNLDPSEVCNLVEGLSPRAYRKEIERGVAEIAKKLRLVEEGSWCQTREPLLRAVVAGIADDEETRQAQRHLANCRSCASFVGKLNGQLHELGGVVATGGLAESTGMDASSLVDRAVAIIDRAKATFGSAFSRGSDAAEQAVGPVVSTGGGRGAGLAGAGAITKIAGLGAAPKLVAACLGTGAAASACVAAGVVPGLDRDRVPDRQTAPKEVRVAESGSGEIRRHASLPLLDPATPPAGDPETPPSASTPPVEAAPPAPSPAPTPSAEPAPAPEAPSPTVQEFEPVGVPVNGSNPSASTGGGGGGGTASSSSAGGDFGP